MICKHVYYHGNVQGVGFRYTAAQVVTDYEVTGFVRNIMMDGRVEIVAEGKADQVHAFLARIAEALGRYITDCKAVDEEYGGDFAAFTVKF